MYQSPYVGKRVHEGGPALSDLKRQHPEGGTPLPAMFPPVLYVPAAEDHPHDGNLTIQLRNTRDGRIALLVYSALDRLVRCCGEGQPWVIIPTPNLGTVWKVQRFDLVLLDVEIPEVYRCGGIEYG